MERDREKERKRERDVSITGRKIDDDLAREVWTQSEPTSRERFCGNSRNYIFRKQLPLLCNMVFSVIVYLNLSFVFAWQSYLVGGWLLWKIRKWQLPSRTTTDKSSSKVSL